MGRALFSLAGPGQFLKFKLRRARGPGPDCDAVRAPPTGPQITARARARLLKNHDGPAVTAESEIHKTNLNAGLLYSKTSGHSSRVSLAAVPLSDLRRGRGLPGKWAACNMTVRRRQLSSYQRLTAATAA